MKRLEGFKKNALQRRSIRNFKQKPISKKLLEEVIQIACWAPSAGNLQDWEFTVVQNKETITRLAGEVQYSWQTALDSCQSEAVASALTKYLDNFTWFKEAPALIVVSCKRPEAFLCSIFDNAAQDIAGRKISAAMAVQNLLLAADAAGLGTCCLTGPLVAEKEIREVLELGKRRDLVCMVAIGYPDETPEIPARLPLEKVLRYFE